MGIRDAEERAGSSAQLSGLDCRVARVARKREFAFMIIDPMWLDGNSELDSDSNGALSSNLGAKESTGEQSLTEKSDVLEEMFPHIQRVFYRKAPLKQVTCQVRFPTILRIDTLPSEFQEKIRQQFPLLEQGTKLLGPQQLPVPIMQAIQLQMGVPSWRFLTEDRLSTISLSNSTLVLSTTSYTKWEDFMNKWRPVYGALVECYLPSYLTSVSLRYQDFINRQQLGLNGIPWSELIRNDLLGEAAIQIFEKYIEGLARVIRVRVPPHDDLVVLQHGIAARQPDVNTLGYTIDLDFGNTSKTEVNDAEFKLNRLHRNVGNAFRWCITDKLHKALDPVEFDDATN
jgi:uncharacterized protein (TIGR04255 family)